LQGFSLQFWGELIGDERRFNAGRHQRLVGRLESEKGLNHDEAECLAREAERQG